MGGGPPSPARLASLAAVTSCHPPKFTPVQAVRDETLSIVVLAFSSASPTHDLTVVSPPDV